MILNNGIHVVPYLREAWNYVKEGTSPIAPDGTKPDELTPPPLGDLSSLMDIIEKGRQEYHEGISFRRWYLKVTQKYGLEATTGLIPL